MSASLILESTDVLAFSLQLERHQVPRSDGEEETRTCHPAFLSKQKQGNTGSGHVSEGTLETAPFSGGGKAAEAWGGGGQFQIAGLNPPRGDFDVCWSELGRGGGLTPAHDVGISDAERRRRRSASRPGTASGRGREARQASPNPVCGPREKQRLPAPAQDTVLVRVWGDAAKKRGVGGVEVPPALPEEEDPRPARCRSQEGMGGSGRRAQGKCGGFWVSKQEEPQSRRSPTPGKGPGSPATSTRSPDAPGAPPACEKTEHRSLTTASSPAPAPPSHFPPATAAAAALGMIH